MTPGVGAAATRAVVFVLALAVGLLGFTPPALVSGEPEGEVRVGVARLHVAEGRRALFGNADDVLAMVRTAPGAGPGRHAGR